MASKLTLLCVVVVISAFAVNAELRCGVAKVNATLPTGVPLAGYNHGARAAPHFPIPELTKYTTFMAPSQGHLTPTWAKALICDNGIERVCFITIDAIGSDSSMLRNSVDRARSLGANVSYDQVTLHGSHSHSGPGAISPNFLWAIAPATDLYVPELAEMMVNHVANAIVEAEANMVPATIGFAMGDLENVTVNRRAKISPYLQPDSIDKNLGLIRVDDAIGKPIATVWNYAIHGVCWGPDQMLSNSDIMGSVSDIVEDLVGGVALFINADAGDIDPAPSVCAGKPDFAGGPVIASRVQELRETVNTTTELGIAVASEIIPFGETKLNITLQRLDNCTIGGPLDICTLCRLLRCDVDVHLNSGWMEENPRFTAFKFTTEGETTLMVTIPGEALSALGSQIRGDGLQIGFDRVMLAGYTNAHMGYFATPEEYDIGGYESELTFWGIQTSQLVRSGCDHVANLVKDV